VSHEADVFLVLIMSLSVWRSIQLLQSYCRKCRTGANPQKCLELRFYPFGFTP